MRQSTTRSYPPLDAETVKLMSQSYAHTIRIPNPYAGGASFHFIEALKTLGVDKVHSFVAVKRQMLKTMNSPGTVSANGKTDWERFNSKREVKLDCNGRIMRIAESFQHVKLYGLKLLQVGERVLNTKGMVVDILREEHGSPLYRLNTNSCEPVNAFRNRRKPNVR